MSENQNYNWLLKFISGKYQGEEFPLVEGQEYRIGRSSECEMVLVEDMVSRQHAKVFVRDDQPILKDLNSTNGSFVNGERVSTAQLKEGDRILFGTSIIKLIHRSSISAGSSSPTSRAGAGAPASGVVRAAGSSADGSDGRVSAPVSMRGGPNTDPRGENPAVAATRAMPALDLGAAADALGPSPKKTPPPQAAPPAQPAEPAQPAAPAESAEQAAGGTPQSERKTMVGAMTGDLQEVPLPDLLQLFSGTRKSGILTIEGPREAELFLRNGQLVYVRVDGEEQSNPEKTAYRVLTWTEGQFAYQSAAEIPSFDVEIELPTENLMMEAMRLLDEMNHLGEVPSLDSILTIRRPLEARLSELDAELLDTLQLVINFGLVETILNQTEESDLDVMQRLQRLIDSDYVETVG